VEEVFDTGQYETVYNVRIADYHTYFVGGEDWGFSVWAHNNNGTCGKGGVGGTTPTKKDTGSHSEKLGKHLEATGNPRPPGHQAAHIVPTNSFSNRSDDVKKAIATAQEKFDKFLTSELRDTTVNGFWAEAGHAGTHTDKFFLALGQAFRGVNSERAANSALDAIWKRIKKGEFIP
jgi:hypothetical protein